MSKFVCNMCGILFGFARVYLNLCGFLYRMCGIFLLFLSDVIAY